MKHFFFGSRILPALSCCALTLAGAWVSSTKAQTYSAPLVINDSNCTSDGCTFRGNWESNDANTPAVRVETSRRVIIENSRVRSRGHLIQAAYFANLTVRNTRGYGLNPNIAGRSQGRFVQSDGANNLVVENCYIEGTTGIYLIDFQGSGTSDRAVRIRYNVVRNIDGRKSNGNGGYWSGEFDFDWAQFVQLNKCYNMGSTEIAWNEVINYPFQSRVEDNINISRSDGTPGNPIRIHNNYIQGAYPIDPINHEYSGGGILLADGPSNYVSAYNNQVVSTTNYGIAIQGGHDNKFHDNRVISSGLLPDGRPIRMSNTGLQTYNWAGDWYNIDVYSNEVGWVRPAKTHHNPQTYAQRWDWELNNVSSTMGSRNTRLPDPITRETEAAEFTRWKNKSGSSSIFPGPTSSESNRVSNPSFDAENFDAKEPSGWREWGGSSGSDADASFTELNGGGKSGARHGTHWKKAPYEVTTYSVNYVPNGLYTLTAWIRSSGGQQTVRLYARAFGGSERFVDIPRAPQNWVQISIRDILVSNGQCNAEFYSKAQTEQWIHFDDVELRKQ